MKCFSGHRWCFVFGVSSQFDIDMMNLQAWGYGAAVRYWTGMKRWFDLKSLFAVTLLFISFCDVSFVFRCLHWIPFLLAFCRSLTSWSFVILVYMHLEWTISSAVRRSWRSNKNNLCRSNTQSLACHLSYWGVRPSLSEARSVCECLSDIAIVRMRTCRDTYAGLGHEYMHRYEHSCTHLIPIAIGLKVC